jgi:hypothetical protein
MTQTDGNTPPALTVSSARRRRSGQLLGRREMPLMWTVVMGLAEAAVPEHHLVWDLSVRGQPLGHRELTVRYLDQGAGSGRILEAYTKVEGSVGPIKLRYRQRMTAYVSNLQPADFSSVADQGGELVEVQGRWSSTLWSLTVTTDGRTESTSTPSARIDLSTADLMDPQSSVPLSHFTDADVLIAETGQLVSGTVEALGVSEIRVKDQAVSVSGFAWTSPQGRSEFFYSPDGFLVRYHTQLAGVEVVGTLRDLPPTGVDDFPVGAAGASVDSVDL